MVEDVNFILIKKLLLQKELIFILKVVWDKVIYLVSKINEIDFVLHYCNDKIVGIEDIDNVKVLFDRIFSINFIIYFLHPNKLRPRKN